MESKRFFFVAQLRLVGNILLFTGFFAPSQVVGNGISEPATVSRIMVSQQFMVDTVYTSKKLSYGTSNLFGPSNATGDEPVFQKKHHFCEVLNGCFWFP